jgi:hypothetical protein
LVARLGGHWKGINDPDGTTCTWVSWFNAHRFHGELGDLAPAETEDHYFIANPQTLVA